MGYIEANVFARVPLVKLEQQIIEPFSQADVQRLLDSQDRATYLGLPQLRDLPVPARHRGASLRVRRRRP